MLSAPEHQVAGHRAAEGQLGPLVDGAGLFYKPLQGDDRGAHEAAFYSSFSSDPRVPPHVRAFFPGFHGTQLLPASDGSGPHPHLVLDDLAVGLRRPSLIDLKIGARTWYPSASDEYFRKCLKKDRDSTSLALGFRVSGVRIHQGGDAGFWQPDRDAIRRFTAKDVRRTLRQFVSSNPSSDADPPDCAFASTVYGGSNGVLAQLLELKAWFEDQTLFHFYSASVLVMYEMEEVEAGRAGGEVRVKLVDFAHVMEGNGIIDHNFLGGLCSLIKFISEILTDPDECLVEPKKAHLSFENEC
ncbi:inositol polyphosphate multikinase beta-like [Phoenix dactylifera]|uniref:Inositol polyphosphate multikinase n=1 Tax=Phoenix dactylifera TaxID=42345 RepID=A0A8B8ZLQ4_PHODC|nr:inositol polyphosphate multikinase beta-like [Phoenix dactylifera]XP_038972563.1 inositol polyphosphate multikinase beta-like [Phoenix dactylifera]XP_038972564.1 inositol polyphosphate multikinase beta-like [Phoenix dactylifera]